MVASLVTEHRLLACELSSFGSVALEHKLSNGGAQAWLLHGMWDLPGSGIEPVSPALAGNSLPLSHQGRPMALLLITDL